MAKKLYILHKLPTPYNDDLFRALNNYKGIDLQVYHLWKGSERRPWGTELATGYPNHFMNLIVGVDWLSIKQAWKDKNSLFIIGDWAHTPNIALLLTRIFRKSPVALWVDTPQEQLPRAKLKQFLRKYFLTWLLNKVDLIFGSGKPAKRVLITMGAQEDKIVDFQFVVDLDKPIENKKNLTHAELARKLRKKVGCENEGVVFGISGTIDLQKKAQDIGLTAFSNAVKQSKQEIGLLIAGDGKEFKKIQDLVNELGIYNQVELLGWLEPNEMDHFYMAIDVLLHPAYYDPFPLAVIEAMSWSVPVIGSTTCGSIEERVKTGVNGITTSVGDISEITTAILKFTEPSFLLTAGAAARETAESWPISRIVKILDEKLKVFVK